MGRQGVGGAGRIDIGGGTVVDNYAADTWSQGIVGNRGKRGGIGIAGVIHGNELDSIGGGLNQGVGHRRRPHKTAVCRGSRGDGGRCIVHLQGVSAARDMCHRVIRQVEGCYGYGSKAVIARGGCYRIGPDRVGRFHVHVGSCDIRTAASKINGDSWLGQLLYRLLNRGGNGDRVPFFHQRIGIGQHVPRRSVIHQQPGPVGGVSRSESITRQVGGSDSDGSQTVVAPWDNGVVGPHGGGGGVHIGGR
ncbi:hypothetical protein ES703_78224 [subsurface metagenome]